MEPIIFAFHAIVNGSKCATNCAISVFNYLCSFVRGSCTSGNKSILDSEERVSSPLCSSPQESIFWKKSSIGVLLTSDSQSFRFITRFAGLSGLVAIVLAAYGSNALNEEAVVDKLRKKALQNATKHHFIHTFGLLHSSRALYPYLTAFLFSSGIVIYCASCYRFAIWNDGRFRKYAPVGGFFFMLGWCSFIL